jgi:DNA polymerase-3 subunit epsilon
VIALGSGSRPWREASFAVLDFETTGLDLKHDHVLSYGLVPIDLGRIRLAGAVYRVVRPPSPLPPASIRVHGIRPVEVEHAPSLVEVAAELLGALEGRTLVAHAAWIELGFLGRLERKHGHRMRRTAVDVIELAARVAAFEGVRLNSARLADLATGYGIPVVRTHHAFGDALLAAQLFLVLATRLERKGAVRLRDLAIRRRAWLRHPPRR